MTKVIIPCETSLGENRVSATPETVKKLNELGCEVYVEKKAGELSGFNDFSYIESGAKLFDKKDSMIWQEADIVLCVQCPEEKKLIKLL